MNAEEIRAKAKWLSEMYAAKANGEVLQLRDGTAKLWLDHNEYGPTMQSYMSNWRLKPKPRRMWEIPVEGGFRTTTDENEAAHWKTNGHSVTEWQEVLPE